jgi:hypothetical protein
MKSHQILIWIGCAIAVCVAVAWALTTSHFHPENVSQTEMSRVIDYQKSLKDDIRHIDEKIDKQTTIIQEIYKWQVPPEH